MDLEWLIEPDIVARWAASHTFVIVNVEQFESLATELELAVN